MRLHVGCPMWTHKAWPTRGLRSYAQWCNAVEGNTTFYAIPARATVESWARQTKPGFRFVVKLPKTITHEGRLHDIDAQLRTFLHAIEPLGARAHALWVQLPGSFGPGDVDALAGFLRRLPESHRSAVEVRHRAFFDDPRAALALERVLGDAGAEWVTFDTTALFESPPATDAERESWAKKPRMPRRVAALTEHPIVRYIGRDDSARTVEGWQYWMDVVHGWLREGRSPTFFVHTPDNDQALTLARRFHDDLRARLPGIEALPEPMPTEPLTLF